MERILFERPREKLQTKGAAYLSTVELLQVIIGSGNAKASAARLARRVTDLFNKGTITYALLLGIDGIGSATACQILAAVELGARSRKQVNQLPLTRITRLMSGQRQKVLVIYLFDGANRELLEKIYALSTHVDVKTLIRNVSTDAMLAGSRSVILAIGYKKAILQADTDDLVLTQAIVEAFGTLQITVSKMYLANSIEANELRAV